MKNIIILLLISVNCFGQNSFTGANNTKAGASTRQARMGGVIKDFYTDVNNSGTSETDFYPDTLPANTLNAAGEKIIAEYAGTTNDITASITIKVYFAGVELFTTGATPDADKQWNIKVLIIRTGATTARATVTSIYHGSNATVKTIQTDLTELNFATTNILKLTGTASGGGGGTGDATAKLGTVYWYPAQ